MSSSLIRPATAEVYPRGGTVRTGLDLGLGRRRRTVSRALDGVTLATYIDGIHHVHPGWRFAVAITQIDLDEEALAEAMRLLGTTTKKDTVNKALQETAARLRRIEAMRQLQAMGARGEFDKGIAAYEARKRAQHQ
jgi:Arc/MetJ family transcription regulator